ncbi:caspase family protein [Labrys portucalensis]|uniref:Caspase family protein n=1 Tax=Labrys neptuniae TaxID=376174 RepID=A0ABV6ZM00_9HYPH
MKSIHGLIAITFIATLGILATGPNGSAWAAGTCEHRAALAGASGKRVAVIVGNGGYGNGVPALLNPARDAEAVAKAMGALGFEIFLAGDADSAGLQNCLATAYAGAVGADVAMFYYSGHGIQIKDENYLVATDATSKDLQHGFVPVQPIVDTLQKGAKATLVFLDACRNNPMAEGGQAGLSVSTGRGLARVEGAGATAAPGTVQARGLMVAYATSPNAVALDGKGELSPFTGAFVKAVGTSGYSIQRIMSDVTKAVGEETDWAQTPWMKSSLTDELKLGGGQTLAEAQSVSNNHATRSLELLYQDSNKQAAIIEALKGLPSQSDDTALKRFPKAYLALYTAVQSRQIKLPVDTGKTILWTAVSPLDRVGLLASSADYQSGELDLWSTDKGKIVARLALETGARNLLFSPHGKFLAVSSSGKVSVLNGLDGTKLFDLPREGAVSMMDFSPDESRLLLAGDNSGFLTVIDVATGKPMIRIKESALGLGKVNASKVASAVFGGNDAICLRLQADLIRAQKAPGGNAVAIFDLRESRTTHLRSIDASIERVLCDPTRKYLIGASSIGLGDGLLEIWDLARDEMTEVKTTNEKVDGLDPSGRYVRTTDLSGRKGGFVYELATGRKVSLAAIPDGFQNSGPLVYNMSGGVVGLDMTSNPWRDWPDESLFGPSLVQKAEAGLTPPQRQEVARDRITFAEVATAP